MKNLVVLYTLIAALAVVLVTVLLHRTAAPLVDPTTAALVDSLRRTHASDSVRIDHQIARSAALARAADSATARAQRVEARAATAGAQASATAAEARSADRSAKVDPADSSARLWHAAYDQRTAEADSLRRALALRAQADTNRVVARGLDTASVSDLRARLARADAAAKGLQEAIDRANKRGHLFGRSWLPEPTRTESAIGGTVVGILVDQLVIKPRQK